MWRHAPPCISDRSWLLRVVHGVHPVGVLPPEIGLAAGLDPWVAFVAVSIPVSVFEPPKSILGTGMDLQQEMADITELLGAGGGMVHLGKQRFQWHLQQLSGSTPLQGSGGELSIHAEGLSQGAEDLGEHGGLHGVVEYRMCVVGVPWGQLPCIGMKEMAKRSGLGPHHTRDTHKK